MRVCCIRGCQVVVGHQDGTPSTPQTPQRLTRSLDVKQHWSPRHLSAPRRSALKLICSTRLVTPTSTKQSAHSAWPLTSARLIIAGWQRGGGGRRGGWSDTKSNLCALTSGPKRRLRWCESWEERRHPGLVSPSSSFHPRAPKLLLSPVVGKWLGKCDWV